MYNKTYLVKLHESFDINLGTFSNYQLHVAFNYSTRLALHTIKTLTYTLVYTWVAIVILILISNTMKFVISCNITLYLLKKQMQQVFIPFRV